MAATAAVGALKCGDYDENVAKLCQDLQSAERQPWACGHTETRLGSLGIPGCAWAKATGGNRENQKSCLPKDPAECQALNDWWEREHSELAGGGAPPAAPAAGGASPAAAAASGGGDCMYTIEGDWSSKRDMASCQSPEMSAKCQWLNPANKLRPTKAAMAISKLDCSKYAGDIAELCDALVANTRKPWACGHTETKMGELGLPGCATAKTTGNNPQAAYACIPKDDGDQNTLIAWWDLEYLNSPAGAAAAPPPAGGAPARGKKGPPAPIEIPTGPAMENIPGGNQAPGGGGGRRAGDIDGGGGGGGAKRKPGLKSAGMAVMAANALQPNAGVGEPGALPTPPAPPAGGEEVVVVPENAAPPGAPGSPPASPSPKIPGAALKRLQKAGKKVAMATTFVRAAPGSEYLLLGVGD